MPQGHHKIHGIVSNASQQPQPGLTVRAFSGAVELGSARTNAQGYFEIAYISDQVVNLVLRVYVHAGKLWIELAAGLAVRKAAGRMYLSACTKAMGC